MALRSRVQVMQALLDLYDRPAYLEIGVAKGATFMPLRAARKVAVDPGFRFDIEAAGAEQPHAAFHSTTSDDYFARPLKGARFQVVFLDGLHVFEQLFRDLVNTLSVVAPDGVIVIDDIFPTDEIAALPDPRQAVRLRRERGIVSNAWMGDVFRIVPLIDTLFQRWSFACIADNHGQLVMWPRPRAAVEQRTLHQMTDFSYERAVEHKDMFRFRPFDEIVATIRADLGKP